MKRALLIVAALLAGASLPATAAVPFNPVTLVNPFIGTSITFDKSDVIDDFPGADVPFGMVQWSPDTPSQNAGGGYEYMDKAITGFSLTHLAGPGCSVFGDFGILPTVGAVTAPAKASQPFSHDSENAAPGYYAVTVGNPGIRAELTVTKRTGLGSFTFPASSQANLLFNASSNQSGVTDASIRIDGNHTIEGSATTGQFCGMPDIYKVYFVAKFDRPFASYGTWKNAQVAPNSAESTGAGSGGWVTFDTTQHPVVKVKVGLSFVSEAGALANLQAENEGWNLVTVRNDATAAWQRMLSRVQVAGGTRDEQRIFYTALYHALLHPNLEDDVTGLYPGFDGKIHHVRPGRHEYANFSGWDIYRTQAALMGLLAPREASDAGQSLVDDAQQGGWLPKWALVNGYTAVMAGDPADVILAAYYAFGARDFDTHAALAAMVKGAALPAGNPPGQGWYLERPGIAEYLQRGYVVNTHTTNVAPVPNGASETLEYAVADFSIAQFARELGDMSVYHAALQRSQNWANVFDTATGWMAPRGEDGAFMQTPITANGQSGFQEGNAAQYTWMVPQDYADLVRGIGGRDATIKRLDTYFSQINAQQDKPYSWMGNEPSIGDPFTYLAAGEPWRAQQVIREVQTTQWFNLPQGLDGNDDLGTMSAWYVWNAMGLYPENPAVRGFAIGTPLFTRVVVTPPGGASIAISAPQASDGTPYVQSLSVNGKPTQKTWVTLPMHGTLSLDFALGATPNENWGTAPDDAPPSYTNSPVKFAPATTAQIAMPTTSLSLSPGASGTLTFSVSDPQADAPVTLDWQATLPEGMHASPSSGTVEAGPSSANVSATISVDPSTPAGYYDVPIGATTSSGALVRHRVAIVHVTRPGDVPVLAYVENLRDNTVTPIDLATRFTAAPIAVGKDPRGAVVSPDRRRVYVVNQTDNTLSVVDAERNTVVTTVKVGQNPTGIAISPDGKTVWVADNNDAAVQAVDTGSNTAAKPIAVGGNPGSLAITPDGKTLFATDSHDGTLLRIDTQSGTVGTPIPVGGHPATVAITPNGKVAYVTERGTNAVVPVDVATGSAGSPIAVGVAPQGIAISPDGRLAFVANSATNTITPIDLTTNTAGKPIVAGGGTYNVVFSPDGKTAFVVTREDDAVVPVDVATQRAGAPIPVGSLPLGIAAP